MRKRLKAINHPQDPLQMAVRDSRLELRLHMPALIRDCPHQAYTCQYCSTTLQAKLTPLKMLHPHGPLRRIYPREPVGRKHRLPLQIRNLNDNIPGRPLLEAELPVPRHVLNRNQRRVRQHRKVIVPPPR